MLGVYDGRGNAGNPEPCDRLSLFLSLECVYQFAARIQYMIFQKWDRRRLIASATQVEQGAMLSLCRVKGLVQQQLQSNITFSLEVDAGDNGQALHPVRSGIEALVELPVQGAPS